VTERDARESRCFPEAESGQLTAETAQSVCTIFTPVEQPRRFHRMGEGKSDGGASVNMLAFWLANTPPRMAQQSRKVGKA
jgi:hypothetical protein